MTDYRYHLTRTVSDAPGRLCWVMLNPSTADETADDPTIRRVKRFTTTAGFGSLIVVNLYAARTTRPVHLREMVDPVGPHNFEAIRSALASSEAVVFAWGAAHPPTLVGIVARIVASDGFTPLCLGRTKAGAPKHPLYVPAAQPLIPFSCTR